MFSPLLYISGFNQTHLWRQSRHDWLFVYILANDMTSFIQPLTYSTRSSKQQNSRHTIKDITYTILNYTENWITLTSIKTRGDIRCPIANTRVNNSKKAKLNIMHVTVNLLGLFFGPAKYISVWQDFHVCQSEWLTTSQQVSGSLIIYTEPWVNWKPA